MYTAMHGSDEADAMTAVGAQELIGQRSGQAMAVAAKDWGEW